MSQIYNEFSLIDYFDSVRWFFSGDHLGLLMKFCVLHLVLKLVLEFDLGATRVLRIIFAPCVLYLQGGFSAVFYLYFAVVDVLGVVNWSGAGENQIVPLPHVNQARASAIFEVQHLRLVLEIWQLSFGLFDWNDVLKLGLVAFEVG